MASVRLGRYEAEDYDLPRVCMRCGGRAVTYKQRGFRWFPRWLIVMFPLGILPYIIMTEVMTKRMAVWVPCCDKHKKRPLWPTLASVGILIALIATAVILVLILDDAGATALICSVGVLTFIIWAFGTLIIHTPAIRPTEITDKSITLKGVCEEFIEALEADRRGDTTRHVRDDRRRRRPPRDDDENDRPRERRRDADEDGGGYYDPQRRRPEARDEDGAD